MNTEYHVAVAFELTDEGQSFVSFSRPQDFRVTAAHWQYADLHVPVVTANGQTAVYHVFAYARRWKGDGSKFEQLNHNEHPDAEEIANLVQNATEEMGGLPISFEAHGPMAWDDPLDEDDFLDEADDPDDFDYVVGPDEDDDLEAEIPDACEPDQTPLGSCCACGKEGREVRNIIMLDLKAPVPGTGWGCVVCGLPSDGAVAVVCDSCLENHEPIRYACKGYAGQNVRVPVESLTEKFEHDCSRHERVKRERF